MNKYIIKDQDLEAAILPYGAAVQSLKFKGIDVALGYETLEEYKKYPDYMGATVGRVANRIRSASFILNGKNYALSVNQPDGGHHHGGITGLDKKTWAVAAQSPNSITLQTTLADGEEGYPGKMEIAVEYALKENALQITYRAKSDKDTLFSPTNHTYFNLDGGGSVEDHLLQIHASFYTPVTPSLDPTGEILSVEGSPLDFRKEKPIGLQIEDPAEQMRRAEGYDHNFCLDGEGFRLAAVARSPKSGIRMECFTDRPGLHLYTANGLFAQTSKIGPLGPRMAFCLETQGYPNAANHPQFPSVALKAGEEFESVTRYRFEMM